MDDKCPDCGTQYVCRRCGRKGRSAEPLRAQLQQARADNARLQAIVDRLPKTTDGVPVVAGEDAVWVVRDDPFHPAGPIFAADVFVEYDDSCECDQATVDELSRHCYSTREAAEAAALAEKTKGQADG